ncbi:TetR/AcrR family transcriptional regulator [Phenylobacterium sp.]|uniref:TetR/AcrR family transcriptional regulator n=1 Tax=Phenylobacterium sp. TaxID=1871053 RepID=UPI002F4094F0
MPTRRAIAKQQTRNRVLAAARKLFSEHGYEGATIRDIAAAAEMSTGAVFANFADKADLFREIVHADMEAISEAMRQAAADVSAVDEALLRMFAAGYGFYENRLPLARAAIAVSWAPGEGADLRARLPRRQIASLFEVPLEAAATRGELSQDPETTLRSDMLVEAYVANFRHLIFLEWSQKQVLDRARDQIRVIMAGARPG